MALVVADPASGRAQAIMRAVSAPTPERLQLALRLALICALTTLVAEVYQTPEPALTAYIVFFLNRSDRTSSLLFNVAMAVIVTIIIALVIGIAKMVVDHPGWRLAAMALISVVMLFLASASRLRPVGGIVAMIIAYALDLLGSIPAGEAATRALLYAWLFVGIPAGVSMLVNLLIAPSPRRIVERALARRLRTAAAMLDGSDAAQGSVSGQPLDGRTAAFLALLRLARLERTSSAHDIEALTWATYSTDTILLLVDALVRETKLESAWREDAAATLRAMARAFDDGGYPVNISMTSLSQVPLAGDFADALGHFTAAEEDLQQRSEAKTGFMLPDAFTNPAHLQYALKTTAAAMICYLGYSLLDWPGIHTALITCYIVSLGTAAETVEKLGLRIVGCLVGAAVGVAAIVWVMPGLETIAALMAVVFAGTLAAGWVAAGSPRIAYAGFQIAFAFFLCVIQGTGPAFDLVVARDRVIGILVGNLVVYLIFTNVWPVSVGRRIDPAMVALLTRLGAVARMATLAQRRLALPALQAATEGIRDDLQLARYEPARLRPSADWLTRRTEAVRAIAAMTGPLVLKENDPATADWLQHLAVRMEGTGDRRQPNAAAPAVPRTSGERHDPLAGHLGRLEEALA